MRYPDSLNTLNNYVPGERSAARDKAFIRALDVYFDGMTINDRVNKNHQVSVREENGEYELIPYADLRSGYYLGLSEGIVVRRIYVGDIQPQWTVADLAKYFRSYVPSWVIVTRRGTKLYFTTKRGSVFKKLLARQIGNRGLNLKDYYSDAISWYEAWMLEERITQLKDSTYVSNEARAILRLGRTEEPPRKGKPVRSGTGDFDAFREKNTERLTTSEKIIDRFPLAPHGVVSSLTWGIEVESGGARFATCPPGWDAKGDGSLRSAYSGSDDEHSDDCDSMDDDEYDCTCEIQGNDCREFVSPILRSFHSRGLESLVTHLSTQPQNDSSGIHVHVGVDDMTPKQIGSLVYGYNMIEPMIEASYQREEREYCKERNTYELKRILSDSKRVKRATDIDVGDRYVTLNLLSLHSHKTVEFRAMGPVYDYEYLIKWAYFCREMVNVARSGMTQKEWNRIDSFEKLQNLFVAKGKESFETPLQITQDDIDKMIAQNGYYRPAAELVMGEV